MAKQKKNRIQKAIDAAKRTGNLPNTTKLSQLKAAKNKLMES